MHEPSRFERRHLSIDAQPTERMTRLKVNQMAETFTKMKETAASTLKSPSKTKQTNWQTARNSSVVNS